MFSFFLDFGAILFYLEEVLMRINSYLLPAAAFFERGKNQEVAGIGWSVERVWEWAGIKAEEATSTAWSKISKIHQIPRLKCASMHGSTKVTRCRNNLGNIFVFSCKFLMWSEYNLLT